MSLLASSSSCNYKYNVFPSFHGPDVRKTLVSHMRKQFDFNGITMFDDQEIERSATIAPALTEAIKDSRISIVILSKKYASSSWCLDELVDILKCKEFNGQIVMTIFYGVEPAHVRKQIGEFGIAFGETCASRTDEERQKWSKALKEVGNIAGEDFLTWKNEAKMIEKIARDVSNKLNATPSRDFDGMVGLEAHLTEMESLLDLDCDGVKMVGIFGAAGIGKTTIAKALQSRFPKRFQLTCFVENLRGSYLSGLDELRLQEQFLSNVLNQDGIRINHSGVIAERLCKLRVLIILDDVNNIMQLMALAKANTWFGPGSRIVVTTENKEILQQHGINDTYQVGFPSDEEALEILCRYAFSQSYPHKGFKKLAVRVTKLCINLPLGLRVVGSSLRGKNKKEWEKVIRKVETNLDPDIEGVLRVGYDGLNEDEQSLFLHIAIFFNCKDGNLVEAMLDDDNLDIKHGLETLENKSLIYIFTDGEIGMHKLLQQFGRKVIRKEEPWKQRILIDAPNICDVLEHATGTRAVSGISFDISDIDELPISERAFKRMPNLRFLHVYRSRDGGKYGMHIPEEMEFPRRLRLLNWEAYPSKSLPPTFHPEYLIELNMPNSELVKLWGGAQPLTNLKWIDVSGSVHLEELPDLSDARKLKILRLNDCNSLVEIPSSFSNLHKLKELWVTGCINLEVIPANMNLASLKVVNMGGCLKLRDMPLISTNIRTLLLSGTAVEDVATSIRLWSRLQFLDIHGTCNLKEITHLPKSITTLILIGSDIERIPGCVKSLHRLKNLTLAGCRRLTPLPELPRSLQSLIADNCESLETVCSPFNTPNADLKFANCFKLGQEARRTIIQRWFRHGKTTLLPGSEVPEEFDHRGKGNVLTIRPNGNVFVVCLVISPLKGKTVQQTIQSSHPELWSIRILSKDERLPVEGFVLLGNNPHAFRKEHLFIFHTLFPYGLTSEIEYEFSSKFHEFDIIDCGAKSWTDESIEGSNESGSDQESEEESTDGSDESGSDQESEDDSTEGSDESGSDS
ncbi:unnamed protein product [Arabidopsis thaliana]|uniref:ADP-ribosyl cyclase/cyclic ADP-ribose hydrolase n=1 Tax=Arabidopsis thaliana TaxID=3702 RepID=A0A5S9WT82_ARATH|nr:unnamed protein product [Arabidopsis thaliana]